MGDRATAERLFNQAAQVANDKSRPEYLQHSYQLFSSAMNADPTWVDAAYQCGNNLSDLGYIQPAIAAWRRALECKMPEVTPSDSTVASRAKVLCNLAWRLECVGKADEAYEPATAAVKIDPNLALGWVNLSIIQTRLGQTIDAIASARKAFALSPTDPTVEMALSFALLFNRKLAEGFKHFECRFAYRLHNFTKYPWPRWEGETGKTIFLVSDQGLGDTLSMTRFLRETCLRSQYVHAAVHPELLRMLQYALMDIPNLNLLPQPCDFPAADAWTTFVSLPFALGLTDDEIRSMPNIVFKPQRTNAKLWKVPDRKLHIGIAWRGSAQNEINEFRSIPVTQFLDLYRVPGVQLYSLQVDANKQQLFDTGCAPLIKDLSGYIRDVSDTMAILTDLDMVVTIESALGHICTLAGIETWVPYSFQGRDWRVGVDGSDQVWSKYRVFPQGSDLRWDTVFDKMVEALRERVNG